MNSGTMETTNKSIAGTVPISTERLIITKTFPQKLMEVVDDPSSDNAIWWQPDGESFVIRPKEFNETLDSCFQGSKLFSFTRKLYRYGFRKIITSQECAVEDLVFSHPCFKKGKAQILHYVTGSNRNTLHSSQAIDASTSKSSSPVKNLSTSKVANRSRVEKQQPMMVGNFSSVRPPVRVTSTFTANPIITNALPRGNFPMEQFRHLPQQQQFLSSHPTAVSAMMLRGAVGNVNSVQAVLLAREHAHQQRLQQLRLPPQQQIPQGIRLGRPGMNNNQSQLLDLLIRKRLSELQGSPPSQLPFP